jgi:hypothetical protein
MNITNQKKETSDTIANMIVDELKKEDILQKCMEIIAIQILVE